MTIQTTEGRYEATLRVDNTNNCPLQEKLGLTRYSISKPPDMIRNIPKYYTTEKLLSVQILKFDVRRPDPDRQLWNRQQGNNRDETQECIIETVQEMHAQEPNETMQKTRKRTIQLDQSENINKKRRLRYWTS